MKKIILFITMLIFINFFADAIYAQENENTQKKELIIQYQHISEYENLPIMEKPENEPNLKLPEEETVFMRQNNQTLGEQSENGLRSPNSTTCVTHYFGYRPEVYLYNDQGVSFSPGLYNPNYYYRVQWQPTVITFPQPAVSVSLDVYDYRNYYYYGARIIAYNENGYYMGQVASYHWDWGELTYNAPSGQKIGYIVVQNKNHAYNTWHTRYMRVCYEDNEAPVAIAQDVNTTTDQNCQATVSASQVDNGSYDPDGDALTYSISPTGPYALGSTNVTLTVSDGELSSSATAVITVVDNIQAVADVTTLPNLTGECDVTVGNVPTATDNCAGSITGTTTDPLYYGDQGTYTINWSYDDGNGNTSTQSQTVIVEDVTAPAADLSSLPDLTGECDVTTGSAPTATDNCAGAITGTTTDPLYYSDQGTYTVNWSYNDGNGNTSAQSQTVIVDDITSPVLDLASLPDLTGECDVTVGNAPTATDNCAGTVTGTTTDPLYYSDQGTYTVNWSYDDGNGNTSTQSQIVIVDDVTAPIITAVASPITLWPPNHKYKTVNVSQCFTSVSDNCESLSNSGVVITSVSSDEDEDANGGGDGNTTDDMVIASDCKSVQLRKERQGNGNGRVYTIHMEIDDGNGNIGTASYQVYVPKNANSTAVDSGVAYEVFGNCGNKSASVFVDNGDLNKEFEMKAYPNPFSNKATIEFTIPQTNHTIIEVYNSMGMKVVTLFNEKAEAGQKYNVEFDGSSHMRGIYYIRLQSGTTTYDVKKMILTK